MKTSQYSTDQIEKILGIVKYISSKLQSRLVVWLESSKENDAPNFISGVAGIWFALYQCQKIKPELVSEELLNSVFNTILRRKSLLKFDLSCCNGLSGLAWLLEYVRSDQEWRFDINANVDTVYANKFNENVWHGEFEYMFGLVGHAPFLLRRMSNEPCSARLFNIWVTALVRLSSRDCHGRLYWQTQKSSVYHKGRSSEPEVNISMAHGMTGVLNALCMLAPEKWDGIESIIFSASDYIMSKKNTHTSVSIYPTIVGTKNYTRLGWCHGDLPLALLFSRLSQIYKYNTEFSSKYACEAQLVVERCMERDAESGFVKDSGLCHGASGIWLMFYTLKYKMNMDLSSEVLRYWENWIINDLDKLIHSGGYKRVVGNNSEHCDNFIEGSAGVLLVLLVMLGQKADWTDILLF